MSDAIGDLLPKQRFSEPSEVGHIKSFIKQRFDTDVSVTTQPDSFIIHVSSAAFAGALRLELHKLKTELATQKDLVIRID